MNWERVIVFFAIFIPLEIWWTWFCFYRKPKINQKDENSKKEIEDDWSDF